MFLPSFLLFSFMMADEPNNLGVLPDSSTLREEKIRDMHASDGLSDADFADVLSMPSICRPMMPGERERDEQNRVIYLSDAQRDNYELQARHGLLYRKDGITPFNTKRFYGEKKLLFVIAKDKKIYAARGVSKKIHHSSFLRGEDVLAAGKIVSRNGKILRLSNNSGHYKPCAEHFLQAIVYFHRLGVLSPDATILLRNEGEHPLKEAIARLSRLVTKEEPKKLLEPGN